MFDTLVLQSHLLHKEKKYALYLPPGYDTSHSSYPVLYLLHGGGGNQTDWIRKGNMQRIMDKAIAEGKSASMIIVMPDAEMTYYMNNAQGGYPFEDFFVGELIPHIEKTYRCLSGKQYRAIAGFSMGGFGALLYTVHHPDLFQSCAAMSAGVWTDEQIRDMPRQEYTRRFSTAMGEVKQGRAPLTEFWKRNNILYLVNQMPEEQKNAVRLYLDIGDDDHLYKGNALLHIALRDRHIPHQYRVRDGGHNWEYWRSGLPDVLAFVSEGFR